MLSPDKPIISIEEDLLNRTPFAKNISRIIREWKKRESLVIGLYGQWGSGKSSLKNLILDILRSEESSCPYIIEFNPWQCSNNELLSTAFFQEIEIILGKTHRRDKSESNEAKERAEKWKMYSSICSVASVGLKVAGAFVPGVSLLGEATGQMASVGESGAKALAAKGAINKTLTDLKKEIDKDLKELDKPILVLIDDVDRLSAEEITLLFQLVKANGDFHNLIYVILCQRSIVEKALEKLAPGAGREFLEKIIQVPFDIPTPSRDTLKKELFAKLGQLGKGFEKIHENPVLNQLYERALKYYFETVRDIRRFLNTLSFHVELLRPKGYLEVNVVDLIALEVLRVFEQGIYERLPIIKDTLVFSSTKGEETTNQESSINLQKENMEFLTSSANKDNKLEVSEILQYLFPHLNFKSSWPIQGDFTIETLKHRRVCHPNYFDRYFQLGIFSDDLRFTNLDKLLSEKDPNQIVKLLEDFTQDATFSSLLVDLRDRLSHKHIDNANVIVNILDFGEIKFKEGVSFFKEEKKRLVWLIFYLRREANVKDEKAKDELLKFYKDKKLDSLLDLSEEIAEIVVNCELSKESLTNILAQSNTVFLLYKIIEKINKSSPNVSSELKAIFDQKVMEFVETKRLILNPLLAKCVEYKISDLNEEQVRGFIQTLIDSDLDLVELISVIYNFTDINRDKVFRCLKSLSSQKKLLESFEYIESNVPQHSSLEWGTFKQQS